MAGVANGINNWADLLKAVASRRDTKVQPMLPAITGCQLTAQTGRGAKIRPRPGTARVTFLTSWLKPGDLMDDAPPYVPVVVWIPRAVYDAAYRGDALPEDTPSGGQNFGQGGA